MCAPVVTEWNPVGLAEIESAIAVDRDHEKLIHQVNRIIARWLPSCSSLALWVSDVDQLDAPVEKLNISFEALMVSISHEELFEDGQSELSMKVKQLYDVAIQFDAFLRAEALAA